MLAWDATINGILLIDNFRDQRTDKLPKMPRLFKSLAHPFSTKISLVPTLAIDTEQSLLSANFTTESLYLFPCPFVFVYHP